MAKKSLLLVDADSKSLRMLEVSLRKSGFSVTTAVHAKDARDKLNHATPDLIITDTKLPGDESGFDFVRALKGKGDTGNIPIIFLSSENRLEQKVAGLELGVEDYLTKPIYIKEVLTRVRVLLDKREKQTLERRERSSSFTGLLGDMGLVDLMQTVEIGRKTGRLFIETRANKGQVSFREGKVCDARSRRLSGERAFYRMLVWNEGTFSMEFGPHDDADVIELSTHGLLMEGMRRVDEWGRLIEQLPPLEHRFEIDFTELVDRLAEIPDEINALLRLFDGRRTLIEVVDETDFGDLEALEIASKLYFEGLIFDVTDREPAADAQGKVEAWLQEPTAHAGDDDGDTQILVPNDTVPPTAASEPASPSASASATSSATASTTPDGEGQDGGTFLAPPSGSAAPSRHVGGPPPPPSLEAPPTPELQAPPPPNTDAAIEAMFAEAIPTIPARPAPPTPPSLVEQAPAEPSRPLPGNFGEEPETRSVLPRTAVGAKAWSSTTVGPAAAAADDDREDWEDIVAPEDEPTPTAADVPITLTPTMGSVPAAHAAPVGKMSVAGRELADLLDDPSEPPATSPLAHEDTLPRRTANDDGKDDGVEGADASAKAADVATARRAADELADELGLSEDELALALAANDAPHDSGNLTVVDMPHRDAELAKSIAAQLDEPPVPDELKRDGFDDDNDTDKGRRRPPPAPLTAGPAAPLTTAPSALMSAADDDSDVGDPIEDGTGGDANVTLPEGPTSTGPANDPAIHTRRPQLDIEPLPSIDRFGISAPMAAGIFVVGFIVVAFAVRGCGDSGAPHAGVDAGLMVAAPPPPPEPTPPPEPAPPPEPTPPEPTPPPPPEPTPPPPPEPTPPPEPAPPPPPEPTPPPPPAPVDDAATTYAKHLKAGDAFAAKGDFGRSVRAYKAAIAVNGNGVAAHLGLGNAYYELDTLNPAIVHLEKARALSPNDPQVHVLLGTAYQSAGRTTDAIKSYERYLALAPDGKFARDVRGILKGLQR